MGTLANCVTCIKHMSLVQVTFQCMFTQHYENMGTCKTSRYKLLYLQ